MQPASKIPMNNYDDFVSWVENFYKDPAASVQLFTRAVRVLIAEDRLKGFNILEVAGKPFKETIEVAPYGKGIFTISQIFKKYPGKIAGWMGELIQLDLSQSAIKALLEALWLSDHDEAREGLNWIRKIDVPISLAAENILKRPRIDVKKLVPSHLCHVELLITTYHVTGKVHYLANILLGLHRMTQSHTLPATEKIAASLAIFNSLHNLAISNPEIPEIMDSYCQTEPLKSNLIIQKIAIRTLAINIMQVGFEHEI